MDDAKDGLGTMVDAMAAVHGLTIEPAWRAAVLANMEAIAAAARLVAEAPLGDREESASLFRA